MLQVNIQCYKKLNVKRSKKIIEHSRRNVLNSEYIK